MSTAQRVDRCTCAGTAPGYPQHEAYCGWLPVDEDPPTDIEQTPTKGFDPMATPNDGITNMPGGDVDLKAVAAELKAFTEAKYASIADSNGDASS